MAAPPSTLVATYTKTASDAEDGVVRTSPDAQTVSITVSAPLPPPEITTSAPTSCTEHRNHHDTSAAAGLQALGERLSAGLQLIQRTSLPVLFERAATSWWDPKFDSELLEAQHWRTSFPQVRRRFQYALAFILVSAAAWCVYFSATAKQYWFSLVVGCGGYCVFIGALLAFTFTPYYRSHHFPVSLCATTVTCALSLTAFFTTGGPVAGDGDFDPEEDGLGVAAGGDMSTIGMFAVAVEIITLVYTFIPMPLYICCTVAGVYSLSFETLSALYTRDNSVSAVVVKVLLHLCIHLIGIHILIMTQVRAHSTFLKVGQSVLVRRQLELEQRLKVKILHSVMPPSVCDWLMREGPSEEEESGVGGKRASSAHPEEGDGSFRKLSSPRSSHSAAGGELRSLFRPFNMNKIEDVSILFADIVGFTRMSSNKSARQLVELLSHLFCQFDALCERLGCEKISTLGDCYYCVSGCPEARPDHARCCVEMGLAMIAAIERFDAETGEEVNMRVGVHTGTVLCGLVGIKRFKFDVWSHDVTLANRMESSGAAGRVHLSAATHAFIADDYHFEVGDVVDGVKTFFVSGRRREIEIVPKSQSGNTEFTYRHVLPRGSKASVRSQPIEEEVDLPGTVPDCNDSTSPMLEHRSSYRSSPRNSWSTINSRKDSGIRSRQSSIQAQHIFQLLENASKPADMLGHRVSGYYSVSQPSIMDPAMLPAMARGGSIDPGASLGESLRYFHHLRKQSDKQLIRGLQQDESHAEYFLHPPISQLSLAFIDADIESEYRHRVHRQDMRETTPTLSSPSFNTYFDVVVSLATYVITAVACFQMFGAHLAWLAVCFLATSWQVLVMVLCFKQFLNPRGSGRRLRRLYRMCTQWYPWHALGAVLVALPMLSILTNFSCQTFVRYPLRTDFFFFVFFTALLHFCNFTQLNCWIKSGIASLGVVTVLAMLESDVCLAHAGAVNGAAAKAAAAAAAVILAGNNNSATTTTTTTTTTTATPLSFIGGVFLGGATDEEDELETPSPIQVSFSGTDTILYEVILDMLLLLALVWMLNREFEISYRLRFHGSLLAARDRHKVQVLKDQAEWLLHNILPKHVAEILKATGCKYSENHARVGVLFATIVNFNELYDESYCGGKECLRVLNELIGDFDELLQRPEFRNVEKIKTIGTTFMAASGLNPRVRRDNVWSHQHLLELMDFAFALLDSIENFNKDILEFNFVMRLGFNFGDVTAGVLGTAKLHYDIWGDAVNIASRMDSTGVNGRIQLPAHCVPVFDEHFEMQERGTIYVKGKDNMSVHLVTGKKVDKCWRDTMLNSGQECPMVLEQNECSSSPGTPAPHSD